jgi:hypothetical protein
MIRYALLGLVLMSGCFASEVSVGRHGLVRGTAGNGGLGVNLNASTYYETGTQNIAGGMSIQMREQGPEREMVRTLGLGARYSLQLGESRDWRGFTRASFGLAPCQLMTCDDPMRAMERRYAFDAQLGIERLLIAPDLQQPQDSMVLSVEAGIAYTHAHDDMIGTGDFIGLTLGARIGYSILADRGRR